jgi:hypothetical protein
MCLLWCQFLYSNWEPKHVTVGLFEATTSNNATMAFKLRELIDKFSLTNKILAYVKVEGPSFQSCATTLSYVVLCGTLGMLEPFCGSSFRHALSKIY